MSTLYFEDAFKEMVYSTKRWEIQSDALFESLELGREGLV
jgi:hypothetical protein